MRPQHDRQRGTALVNPGLWTCSPLRSLRPPTAFPQAFRIKGYKPGTTPTNKGDGAGEGVLRTENQTCGPYRRDLGTRSTNQQAVPGLCLFPLRATATVCRLWQRWRV